MNKQLTILLGIGLVAIAAVFFLLNSGDSIIDQVDPTIGQTVTQSTTTDDVVVTDKENLTSDEPEDGIADEDDEHNEPVTDSGDWITAAYTKPLPPEPTRSDAQNGFPDTNNNKVRDDIELLIVEEWADHEMMVESLFALARNKEHDLKIVSDGVITSEEIVDRNALGAKASRCRAFYYTNTVGTADEYFQEDIYELVTNNYHNSELRLKHNTELQEALHGSVTKSIKVDHDTCQSYFQETRNLDI